MNTEHHEACPVCAGKHSQYLGWQNLSIRPNQSISTDIYLCLECGTAYRQRFSKDTLYEHLVSGASYTDLARVQHWADVREGFFKWILKTVSSRVRPDQRRMLDIGCSYGHLVRLFRDAGWEACGVDVSPVVTEYACRNLGITVIQGAIEEINLPTSSFDVVTMIDSLYYMQEPYHVLKLVHTLLRPEGLLVIRSINRALLSRAHYWLRCINLSRTTQELPFSVLGDAIYSPSISGLRLLLERTAFRDTVMISESGCEKKMSRPNAAIYLIAHVIWLATGKRVLLSPGVLLLTRKRI